MGLLSSAVVRVDPEGRALTADPVPDGGNLRGLGEDVVDLYQGMSGLEPMVGADWRLHGFGIV